MNEMREYDYIYLQVMSWGPQNTEGRWHPKIKRQIQEELCEDSLEFIIG